MSRRRATTSASASPTRGCSRSTPGAGWSPRELRLGAPAPATTPTRPGTRRCARRSPATSGVAAAVRAGADDVLVTNGAQQALDLIGRVLLEPGRRASPSRSPATRRARQLFAVAAARGSSACRSTARAWSSTRCPRAARAGLRHAVAPVPARHADVAGAPARRCWPGPSGTARSSSRTTTTASSASAAGRSSRCRAWTGRPGASTSARSPRRCCPTLRLGFLVAPAVAAAGAARGQAAHRLARRRSPRRRRWPASSTRACWPGTSAGPAKAYAERRAMPAIVAVLLGERPLELVPSAAGLHVTALLRDGGAARAAAVGRGRSRPGSRVDDLSVRRRVTTHDAAGFVFGFGAARRRLDRRRAGDLRRPAAHASDRPPRRPRARGCSSRARRSARAARATATNATPAPRRDQPRGSSRSAAAVPST